MEVNDTVRRFLNNKAFTFAKEVNKTTRDKIKKIIGEGITEGQTLYDIQNKLNPIFGNKARVRTIARTETVRVSNRSGLFV